MSDALIGSLQSEINRLNQALANANGEAAKYRKERSALRKDRDALQEQLRGVTAERDTLQAKATAQPSELQSKLDEALGKLRDRDHRDAWSGAISDQLADKVTVEKVWAELGYLPGDKVPTAQEIAERVRAARDSAPYLFKQAGQAPAAAPGGAQQGNPRPPLKTALEPSRGAPDTAARRFEVRKSDTRNPAWMRQNSAHIAAAREAGTLVFVED